MYDFLLRFFVKVMLLVPLACGMTKKDAGLHPGISDFCWEDFKCSFAAKLGMPCTLSKHFSAGRPTNLLLGSQ